jgi:hypothetical protein
MGLLKQFIKNKLSYILYQLNWLNSNWEDKSLLMLAKNLMASSSWREHAENFTLNSKEFRIYSQWGDDGIIQYLIYKLNIQNTQFIEFGVGNYFESTTHFLLVNNNWSGFIIDGSEKCMNIVKKSPFYWRYDLRPKTAFITKENINELLKESNFHNLGLLHIDLDGNDYWILEAIDMNKYNPDILILEYNSNFGSERQITVPYNPLFSCREAHFSGQYFGASLPALNALATKKGYFFIGCTSAGNNAYFLKNKYKNIINPISITDGFISAKARDERNENGDLIFSSRESSISSIRGMAVYNIEKNDTENF